MQTLTGAPDQMISRLHSQITLSQTVQQHRQGRENLQNAVMNQRMNGQSSPTGALRDAIASIALRSPSAAKSRTSNELNWQYKVLNGRALHVLPLLFQFSPQPEAQVAACAPPFCAGFLYCHNRVLGHAQISVATSATALHHGSYQSYSEAKTWPPTGGSYRG